MSFETVQHTKPVPVPGLAGTIPYAIVPLAIGWYVVGFNAGFFAMCIVLVASTGARNGLATTKWHRSYAAARAAFIERGFKVDFEHDPRLMVDAGQRKIAVVSPADGSYDLFDLSDILGWEHLWDDMNKHTTNSRGYITSSKIVHKNNRLVLKTRNPHKPRYEFPIGNYETGELWMARLAALLKG